MIFYKDRIFGLRFWLLFLLSICLIICDQKRIFFPKIRPYLQMATVPIQYAILLPERGFSLIRDYFTLQHELIHDKKNWQGQKLVLQAKLQELNALKLQNQELESLLKTQPVQQNQHYLFARVISIKSEGTVRELLIDRGSNDGIAIGQAVIAADGIVGQVIQASPINSRIILLSDPKSAIPMTNQRTHDNLIAVGTGNNQSIELLNVMNNADIKVGDILLSSGIGGHYPAGYMVGTVGAIDFSGKNISKVYIKPSANLDRLHNVLVVSVKEKENPLHENQ